MGAVGCGPGGTLDRSTSMLLRLKNDLRPQDLDQLVRVCGDLGFEAAPVQDGGGLWRLAPRPGAALGPEVRSRLEDHFAVAGIVGSVEASELHQRTPGGADTVVRVGDAVFGGGTAALIAGPCAVESEETLLTAARRVRAAGATLLRGGACKPRSSPYSFQGLGREGLELLQRVGREVGLATVTEVLEPGDVEPMLDLCDMFQVGSRNMSNSPLLREVARSGKPVLLKRGMSATAREFLLAAEYLLAGGNDQVVLCERGIRGFDKATRNVLDVGTVAHLKGATHLPVIVDPSHAAGRADLVRPLARSGIAVGADGLIVEVHPDPVHALSDADQAILPDTFDAIAADVRGLLALDGRALAEPTPLTVPS